MGVLMKNTMETHIVLEGVDCIPLEAEGEEVVVEEASQCSNMSKKKKEQRPQLVVN
jgi:hypothetical protein